MRFFPIIFFLVIAVVSCNKNDTIAPEQQSAVSFKNVSYGSDPKQKMDIYLPAERNTSSTKALVLIHGGGWNSGDKSDFDAYVDTLKRRDPSYAIFNLNYRLAESPNLFPAQEMDIKAAMEFIASKSAEYKISEKIILIGASAGGHLALLQAYKYSSPVKVKAVVDFYGPTELVSMYNNPPNPFVQLLLISVTGGTPTTHLTLYQQSSPVNFVTAQSAPTLILHGALDIVVSPSQSILLKNELQAKSVIHEYVEYPDEGHAWVGESLTDSFNRIAAFLAAHVN